MASSSSGGVGCASARGGGSRMRQRVGRASVASLAGVVVLVVGEVGDARGGADGDERAGSAAVDLLGEHVDDLRVVAPDSGSGERVERGALQLVEVADVLAGRTGCSAVAE